MHKIDRILGVNGLICTLLFASILVVNAYAEDGYGIITTAELEKWLESSQKPNLIFSLSEVEYLEERIPDSICIPVELMEQSPQMPQNLGEPVVFYCKGPG